MNQPTRISFRALAAIGLALALGVAVVLSASPLAGSASHLVGAASGPQQAAPDPRAAPLPHFLAPVDANSQVWDIPMHFTSRTVVTIDPPVLLADKGHIMQTAPRQLELQLFDRANAKIQSVYAWHPLRMEYEAVEGPTAVPPRLQAGATGAGPQQDPHQYDPYHRILDQGDGHLFLPFDPRVSTVRIVDLTLGGTVLGTVSVEGAARRYCAQNPTVAFCLSGRKGGSGGVSRATLYFDPYTATVGSNAVFTVELKARKMVDLYGGQVAVNYDPKVLQVVDQDAGRPGAQVKPGEFPKPDNVLRNAANNNTGRLEYFFTLTGEKPGVSGEGTVAHIVLRGVGPGKSLMTITDTVLSDPQSLAIPTKTENALITVLSAPAASVTGQVELERRPTSAGARVCSGGRCVTTVADGKFRLDNVPVGQPVAVTHPSYLRATRLLPASATGTVTWPKVKLLAGDLDKDDRVDIVDAVMIGQRFNLKLSTPPDPRWLQACDITDDGSINILDMVGVQYNMLKVAPGPWPTLLSVAGSPQRAAAPAQTARVSLEPAEAKADGLNVDIPVQLKVEDVALLYGFRVQLHFDPRLLQVKDVSPADDGVQVELGDFLDPINSFVLLNRADNSTGTLDISVTETLPATGANGSGVLATITFRGRAAGTSEVSLPEAVLVDDTQPVPATIPATKAGATVTVTAKPPVVYLPWCFQPK
jgi:hypothetical protein